MTLFRPLAAAAGDPPPRQRPAEALALLAGLLRERGLTHLYAASCRMFGVLSVAREVTVWTNGRVLWWRAGRDEISWPAADAPGAAQRLAELAAASTAAPGATGTGSPGPAGGPGDLS